MIFSDSRAETYAQKLKLLSDNQKFQATLESLKRGENLINVLHNWDNLFKSKGGVELINVSSARYKILKIRRAGFCVGVFQ